MLTKKVALVPHLINATVVMGAKLRVESIAGCVHDARCLIPALPDQRGNSTLLCRGQARHPFDMFLQAEEAVVHFANDWLVQEVQCLHHLQ